MKKETRKKTPGSPENNIPSISPKDLVSPEWKEIINCYVYERDPWDFSVGDMAQRFQQEIDSFEGKNLELSGRMVLTCAVILQAKAETLGGPNSNQEEEEGEKGLETDFFGYEEFGNENYIPDLEIPLKRAKERAITKSELCNAFNDSLEVHERREQRRNIDDEPEPNDWGMELKDEEHFQVKLQRLYRKVKEKISRGKEVLFSTLLNKDTKEEKLHTFMELIHLQSEGKVKCRQDEPFSEIKVKLTEESAQKGQ